MHDFIESAIVAAESNGFKLQSITIHYQLYKELLQFHERNVFVPSEEDKSTLAGIPFILSDTVFFSLEVSRD